MTKKAARPADRKVALRRFARTYLAPHWVGFTTCLLLAAGIAFLTTGLAYLMEQGIDDLLTEKKASALLIVPAGIAAIGVGRALLMGLQLRLINRIGHTVVGELQLDLFSRLMSADLLRLRAAHSGQHVSNMLFDANLVRDGSTHVAVNYLQQLLILLGMVGYMASVDIGLTVLSLVGAPLAFYIIKKYEKRTRRAALGAMGETSALSTVILEGLDGVKVVKIEGREAFERERVQAVVKRRQVFLIRGSNAKALSGPVTDALMLVVIAGILAYAGWRALHGDVDSAEFSAFLIALVQASQSFRQLGGMQSTIGEAGAAASRLFETLDIEPTITDAPGAVSLRPGDSTVRFDQVTFAFGDDAPAVRDVSFEIRKGESVALVGPSGSGKSTILNLIPRFYDVSGGAVTIDGQDVRTVTLRSLRDRIGLVTQEPFLFDDTIRANIAYARPEASDTEIEEAARQAAAHDFITALPNGYATLVGEAGARLSGGQRQRLAIARAFLKDAPIMLLDEATSALDTESEAQVQAALTRLMSGRATLVIAHRLSTIRDATRILVLEQGRIVETGSHADLMRGDGLYARLAASQHLDVLEVAE